MDACDTIATFLYTVSLHKGDPYRVALYTPYLRLVQQDARVELHEQQPGVKRVVALFVREHVVPALGQSISQRLENRSDW